jgi:hypothetical protein
MLMKKYIGIFNDGKPVMRLSTPVDAPEILMERMSILYEGALKGTLREGDYVAWEYEFPE